MLEKMADPESKKVYKQRFHDVEPVFGQIKANKGFTRFKLKGLTNVTTEFTIMNIAHNLGKILRVLTRKPQLEASLA